ncbi:MAG: polysaccharide biosynthesis protein [Deltaproteobacteria bacterium]|nr:polysaccharide biosynthesis protein [Deltaproteobacteria bacterium]
MPKLQPISGLFRGLRVTAANLVIITCSYVLAFLLRFDLTLPDELWPTLILTLPAAVSVHYAAFYAFKLTRGHWRYVGTADFVNAAKASALAALGLVTYVMAFHRHIFYPRSVFLINFVLVVGLSIGARLLVRLLRRVPVETLASTRRRLLIIGAGDTGEALLREIRQSRRLNYHVVAFLDDDTSKRGTYINGVPVLDVIDATPAVAKRLQIDEIIVATPSASGQEMRSIIERCRGAEIPLKVMPATWEMLNSRAGLDAARQVDIHDLLRRPPVHLDLAAIGRFITGKRVLVTGAGGSIGSESCRQVLRFNPATLTCLDHDENALFYLERSLRGVASQGRVAYRLADITDAEHMDALLGTTKPHVIFHAAAHKHVPVIEANPVEGIRNNVFGTETVATLAGRHEVETFVLISTDKAVNPSSVMGASKRIAELLIQTLPFHTRFTAVRFGNVLGSQGSVVPLFKEQIAKGGPITITHPDMRRYFMTIPEAVELVLQAGAMGHNNEVFMLEMGEPVRILDLANDLISLSGLRRGVDVEIVFTGPRPGEKLCEELYLEVEKADRTSHPKILTARHTKFDVNRFRDLIEELRGCVTRDDETGIQRLIPEIVPEYRRQEIDEGVGPAVAVRRHVQVEVG